MDSTNATQNIVHAIMDMDLNDNVTVKNVMEKIINHPFVASNLLGSLIGTKHHRHTELLKKIFFYHDAWTPHDLSGFIFGIDKGPHFLVNVFEPLPYPCHDIPFNIYGKAIKEHDIPAPPVKYFGIKNFVRIDVFGNRRYKIRNVTTSEPECSTADGRFCYIGNVDTEEVIVSLHRRTEGYKIVNELTNSDGDWQPYVDSNDTFENKILNVIDETQKNISHAGDLSELASGLLTGVKVWQRYQESGDQILAVESPIDRTLFMLIFFRTVGKTINEQKVNSKTNMRKLLAHYIPEYVSTQRHTILLAVTYDVTLDPDFHTVDTINSLMHSSESTDVGKAVKSYKSKITLMHRCRQVIVNNMYALDDKIGDLPSTVQRFIYSPSSAVELIDYCVDVP